MPPSFRGLSVIAWRLRLIGAYGVLVGYSLFVTGCRVTLPDATFRCQSDADCPAVMICEERLCVYPGFTSSTAPADTMVSKNDAGQLGPAEIEPNETNGEAPNPAQVGTPQKAESCSEAKDCPGSNDCVRVRCEANRCVSSPIAVDTPELQDAAMGKLWQELRIDANTSSLSFQVHGGHAAVVLYADGRVVRRTRARDTNAARTQVVWRLESLRGKTVRLSIEDDVAGPWAFISVGGFELH